VNCDQNVTKITSASKYKNSYLKLSHFSSNKNAICANCLDIIRLTTGGPIQGWKTNSTIISVKVFEHVPSFGGNPWPGKHLVPMLRLIWSTSAAHNDPANLFVWSNVVTVHYRNRESCSSNSIIWNVKNKWFIEARLGCSLFCLCLLLLHFFVLIQQPDLHIRVWKTQDIDPLSNYVMKCFS